MFLTMKRTNRFLNILLPSFIGRGWGWVFFFTLSPCYAQPQDSVSHWGLSASVSPGRLIVMDEYQRKFQKNTSTTAFSLQVDYTPQPADGNPFATDFNYPTFSYGVRLNRNNITMHRNKTDGWGMAEEVDYDSRLGNIITAYGTFTRPVLVWPRHAAPVERRFEVDYMLGTGIGYALHKYSPGNNIDNELIGSRFNVYFIAGTHATWHITPSWAVFGGVEYYHHSNGALNRPNKGANYWGPVVGVKWRPEHSTHLQSYPPFGGGAGGEAWEGLGEEFAKGAFLSLSIGVGAKTLNEDWQVTQFHTPPDSVRYRTGRFHMYATYSLQADMMYRYARRWASGIGIDAFYGTYADRIREIENAHILSKEKAQKVSPWSVGVALKHNVYYGNLSARMSLGYYLLRRMGTNAKEVEKPYYERIGVHYSFPKLNGLTIGASIKAHLTKADLTEVIVSYPFSL